MRHLKIVIFWLFSLCFCLLSCEEKVGWDVTFFKGTEAYELAKAVEKGNLGKIERLVKEDSTLLHVISPNGSNVLVLCVYVEQYASLRILLELGADSNFIDPFTKYSVLIEACRPFDTNLETGEDNRYAKLLLQYGADPTYAVEYDFTNEKGHYVGADSPLMRASGLNLELVKVLINYGADPYRKLGKRQEIPLTEAIEFQKFDIIFYYIDTLNVDVHQPMGIIVRMPDSEKFTYYIQDYIKKSMDYLEDSEGYEKEQELIKNLEAKGVDFENYEYKIE